ncbi:acetyl-CoA carboxylase biotin carboxylase subunit family protein [Thiomicrospira sp. ALE5]|uniref:ATP-grasp domain-containing protein n=1 Tax=Thiomicrospira sp. ALE5 TaxID=748650 RepID=UPI0008E52E1A|nr:ATP-grasp domain-containing protein [Thiomicrospira sp. ALE5]SFR49240.1 Biotin carboxylase [Thiomicrospira sp. ALE5]
MQKNKPKMLIAGGGYADIPLIHAAQSLGYYVITSGNRESDLGHIESDQYCPGDFSDPEAMLRIAQEQDVEAVCACCNDFSALSAAYVAEKLGLPGHDSFETALTIHHKDRYRAFAENNAIPTPKALGYSDIENALNALDFLTLPVIIKPVDLTGGKGITRVDSHTEFHIAIEYAFLASKCKRVVVEEFIEGTRHGFSVFVKQGKVVFHFTDNEHYHLSPYLVSAASTPSEVPKSAITNLIGQSEKICRLLSLVDGIFHVQFILRDGEPYIIEICRRAPGDLYVKLVEIATGAKYSEWIVRAAAGLDISDLRPKESQGGFVRHCIMGKKTGTLAGVYIDPLVEKRIVDRLVWWKEGDIVENPETHKFGILFVKYDDSLDIMAEAEKLSKLVKVDVI